MQATRISWPFGDLLVEKGLITQQELEQALLKHEGPATQPARPATISDELALLAEVAAQDLTIAGLLERLEEPLASLSDLAQVPESRQADAETSLGFLVFAPSGDRYVIAERDGPVPSPGSKILFGEPAPVACLVTKLGQSPLPLDHRPCVYLQPLQ